MVTLPRLIAIALCAALNVAVGSVVYLVKLPIYLDSIGTILCALLIYPDRSAAFVCSLLAAMISTTITTIFINPFSMWSSGTEVAIALVAAFVVGRGDKVFRARPVPILQFCITVLLFGILAGTVAAVVSAPVVAYIFSGVTGSGSALLVAIYLKAGEHLMTAVLHSGLTSDPIDKILQVLFAALLLRATPADFIAMVRTPAGPTPTRRPSIVRDQFSVLQRLL
jgi:energy-coupling factor transport system substrate-specific component